MYRKLALIAVCLAPLASSCSVSMEPVDALEVYWEEDFENLSHAPYATPDWRIREEANYPFDFIEQGNGQFAVYPGQNIIALDSQVRRGQTSLLFTMNRTSADIPSGQRRISAAIDWDKHIDSLESWRSFWLYLPEDFVCGGWISMIEYEAGGGDPWLHAKWHLCPVEREGKIYLKFYMQWPLLDGKTVIPSVETRQPFPRGRWVHAQVYFRRAKGTGGRMTVWHDTETGEDAEVLNLSGFTSEVDDPATYRMMIQWSYYSPYGPNSVYWDDMVVAASKVPRGYVPD